MSTAEDRRSHAKHCSSASGGSNAEYDFELASRPAEKGGTTLCGKLGRKHRIPPSTTGATKQSTLVVDLVRKPIRVSVPRKTSRALLDLEDTSYVSIIRNQDINHDDGYGYEEDVTHEQECSNCEKTFVFRFR